MLIESTTGGATILLVEDEEVVREFVRQMLVGSGYEVLKAENGGEALRASASHEGAIHLLLADVVMPEMNGLQLAQHLAGLRPQMEIQFMSVDSGEDSLERSIRERGAPYLSKPFTKDILVQAVREVLAV